MAIEAAYMFGVVTGAAGIVLVLLFVAVTLR